MLPLQGYDAWKTKEPVEERNWEAFVDEIQNQIEKICPWCHTGEFLFLQDILKKGLFIYTVECDNCHSHGPTASDPETAVNEWNRLGEN